MILRQRQFYHLILGNKMRGRVPSLAAGETFNRWKVIKPVHVRGGRLEYECECECGNRSTVQAKHLTAGRSRSCGCYRREIFSEKYTAKIVGKKYGKLTVIEKTGTNKRHQSLWLCRCDCGNMKMGVTSSILMIGHVKSCGCTRWTAKHGQSSTNVYKIWNHIRQRCSNPKLKQWMDYGGRGITVCERWNSFKNFLEDMGPRPSPLHSIDRKNNDGNYEPSNCKWATRSEQARNKRTTKFVKLDGVEIVLEDAIQLLRKRAYVK